MIYCMRTRIFFSVNNTDYLLVPNFRIIEFQSHGISRTVTDFLFFFSCPEFSRLVLGPTDQREVISELFLIITRRIAEGHGRQKFDNSIIRDKEENPCEEDKIRKFGTRKEEKKIRDRPRYSV